MTLAGFAGAAPTGADPFLETTRDAIIQYIRDNDLERPVLVGHSLGGFLALRIAASAPELVGPVVAVDGVPAASDGATVGRAVAEMMTTYITLSILRDLELSRDVAQEVYLMVWRDLGRLREPASFLPWLRPIARNARTRRCARTCAGTVASSCTRTP